MTKNSKKRTPANNAADLAGTTTQRHCGRSVSAAELTSQSSANRRNGGRGRKIFLIFALALTFTTSVFAQTLPSYGTVTLNSGQTTTNNVTLTGSLTINVPSGSATVAGIISSNAGYTVTKTGNGKLYFTAKNTYQGNTIISQGKLSIGKYINSLQGDDGGIAGATIEVQAGAELLFETPYHHTYAGCICGEGDVYHDSYNGTLTLTGVNTYTGKTTIKTAKLKLGTNAGIAKSSVIILNGDYAEFDISEKDNTAIKRLSSNAANAKVIIGAGHLYLGTQGENDGGGTYKGKITGNDAYRGITKFGSETLKLSNASSSYGRVNIGDGIIEFSYPNDVGSNEIHFFGNGGTLRWAAGNTTDVSSKLRADNSNIVVKLDVGSNHVVFNTALNTAFYNSFIGKIEKLGSGILTLNANQSSYGNDITVSAGTLRFTATTFLSNVSVASNAILTFEPTADMTYSKQISGAGTVGYYGGSKKLTVTGNCDNFSGNFSIQSGRVNIGNGGATGSIPGNIHINSGAELAFNRTGMNTYPGKLSGNGTLYNNNTGIIALTGNSPDFSGNINVQSGILWIGDGDATNVNIGSYGTISLASGTHLYFMLNADMSLNRTITGQGEVHIVPYSSSQTLKFSLYQAYTGETSILRGGLEIHGNIASPKIDGGISSRVDFVCNNDRTYSGVISGGGDVVKSGTGKLTLNGVNTYTGETNVNGGTLALGANGKIENSSHVNLNNNAKLDISADIKTIKMLHSNYSTSEVILAYSLTINGEGSGTFLGKFNGTKTVTKQGSGTLTLAGNNTASTNFSLEEGTLVVGTNDENWNWAGNFQKLANGTTLTVKGNATIGGNFVTVGGSGSGAINMEITGSKPSKLTIGGEVLTTYVTTLNLTATNNVTNYVLIQAASGITSTTPYTVTGAGGALNVNSPTQLRFTSGGEPYIATTTLPPGIPGNTYVGATLQATGITPITWTVQSGSLPAGLSLNASTGVISGTPSSSAVSTTFVIRATNSAGYNDKTLSIEITTFEGSGLTYQIFTVEDLAKLANLVNVGYTFSGRNFTLMDNLDLDVAPYNTEGWTPIGKQGSFKGNFNGVGRVISNLYINTFSDDIGLFGTVSGSTIERLGLENVNITGKNVVGSIAGSITDGKISTCYSTGNINGQGNVGGIVGYVSEDSDVVVCYSSCTMSGDYTIGGIAGIALDSQIRHCYSTGNVTGNNSIGGIAGYIDGSEIFICYSIGAVSGKKWVSGIAGADTNCNIWNCVALNPSVIGEENVGRITWNATGNILSNNIAFNGILNIDGTTEWDNKELDQKDGEDISKVQINSDGKLGERFDFPTWKIQTGKLPGFDAPLPMPEHLSISFSGGDGSPDAPYQITTVEELANLAELVNAGNTDFNNKHYLLMNPLDLNVAPYNTGTGWTPIGIVTPYCPFRGNFNGGGKVIKNLYCYNDVNSYLSKGLFGQVTGGTIENLGVEDVNITTKSNAGAIVGNLESGSITNCYSTGIITVGEQTAGGITGIALLGSVTNCYSVVEVNSAYIAGGIAAMLGSTSIGSGSVSNCAALNPSVKGAISAGRISHSTNGISNCIAFEGMLNNDGTTEWDEKESDKKDGEDISKEYIYDNPSLDLFESPVWTSKRGYLPGLGGNLVEMPEHLRLAGAPVITTTTLPDGEIGKDYSATLTATGNTPITWTLLVGILPTGLTLDPNTGKITGKPTANGTFIFTIEAENNIGCNEQELSIKVTGEVAIEQLTMDNGQLKIYPNPVSYELQVTSYGVETDNYPSVQIYDIMGRTLMSLRSLPSPETTINVSHLPSGIYCLRIGNKTAKFVKQ